MKEGTEVEIQYRTKNSRYTSTRTITPKRVYQTESGVAPYVSAYCHKKLGNRVFRADRITIQGISKPEVTQQSSSSQSPNQPAEKTTKAPLKGSKTQVMTENDVFEKDESIDHAHVLSVIEVLRKKLLEFSTRNDLINLSHSDRSTKFIRVVDELPNQLYECLQEKSMTFKPLPEVDEEPPDEQTDNFQIALKEAQLTNEDYIAGIEELGDKETDEEELQRLDRQLRDAVREQLGLDPIQRGSTIDVRAHARIHGFDPNYDLPMASDDDKVEEHTDTQIQTLLLPERFERRVRSVADKYRSHLREAGINVFNAAFGFVEWYESSSSDRALFAPLLLMPLDIERKKTTRGTIFEISSSGDSLELNVTFAERLKLNFGITLPEFSDDSTPEKYFAEVEPLIEKQNRWRLRRFVTIGIFPFQKMAMYMDLDPKKWPESHYLTGHDGIAKLLGGRSSEGFGIVSENHDIDQLTVKGIAPGLVLDADASQHSAIVDVCEAKSLVIQGPPGTGKSQTIANLIAAAVSEGKSVLFVAEKQAALNVVANRLKDKKVGLGPLLLELQRRGDRKVMLATLKERLECSKPPELPTLDAKKQQLIDLRNNIEEHRLLLQKQTNFKDDSGFELIWRYLRTQKRYRDLGLEREPKYFGSKFTSFESLESEKNKIIEFFEVQENVSGTGQELQGITRIEPNPIAIRELIHSADEIKSKLNRCREMFGSLRPLLDGMHYGQIYKLLESINDATSKYAAPLLVGILDKPEQFLALCETGEKIETLSGIVGKYVDVQNCDAETAGLVLTTVAKSGLTDFQVGKIPSILESWQGVITNLEIIQRAFLKVPALEDITIDEALQIKNASTELIEESDESLKKITLDFLNEENIQKIEALKNTIGEAQEIEEDLKNNFVDTRVALRDYKPRDFDEASHTLSSASFFSMFSKTVKSTKQLSSLLGINPSNKLEAATALKKLSNYVEQAQSLRENSDAEALLGSIYESEKTDCEKLANLVSTIEKVKSFLEKIPSRSKSIRADLSSLITIKGLFSGIVLENAYISIDELETPTRNTLTKTLDALRTKAQLIKEIEATVPTAGFLDGVDIPTRELSDNEKQHLPTEHRRLSVSELLIIYNGAVNVFSSLRSEFSSELQQLDWREGNTIFDAANSISELLHRSVSGPDVASQNGVQVDEESLQTGNSIFNEITVIDQGLNTFEQRYDVDKTFWSTGDRSSSMIDSLIEKYESIATIRESVALSCARLIRLEKNFHDTSVGNFLEDYKDVTSDPRASCLAFEFAAVTAILRDFANENSVSLADLTGSKVQKLKDDFRNTDQELFGLEARRTLIKGLSGAIPYGNDTGPKKTWTDRALIDNEIGKKRGHISVRALVARAGDALFAMKPIWLMSPLAVSQFLRRRREQFDLLVIDEASQMRPEDALTAVVRAKTIVVVGDDQQLPPTSFFRTDLDSDEEEQEVETESILDLASTRLSNSRSLRWHYRSRHPDLIRFSNKKFYNDSLQTFPSPVNNTNELGITNIFVNGFYKSSVNLDEAKQVVQQARQCMAEFPDLSIGIVAMNVQQKDLIREEFERLMEEDRIVGDYVQKWSEDLEEFIIKNLENIQGDERDIIIVSTVYGRDQETNTVYQRFTGVNSVYGHRRLNVLFSRAKRRLILVTSLRATDVRLTERQNRGVRIFREYLEYAATGRLESGDIGGGAPDSDFEIMVAEALQDAGYQATTQVGVVGFRIDIGVSHEDYPHGYLAGIECDGATYHSNASARDRDRIRQDVLEGLGWDIYRIWSTDWFSNPEVETEKLLTHLTRLRDSFLARPAEASVEIEPIYVN
jgi:very-short-patch-repair endonuclease